MPVKRRYTIDFNKLAGQILPPALRVNSGLIHSFGIPLEFIHTLFVDLVTVTDYYNIHSGQVILLEKVLNDKYVAGYDPTDHDNTRQIVIVDGEKLPQTYIYINAEQHAVQLNLESEGSDLYIFSNDEINTFQFDFVVQVPGSISYNGEMNNVIQAYKIGGRTYKIQT